MEKAIMDYIKEKADGLIDREHLEDMQNTIVKYLEHKVEEWHKKHENKKKDKSKDSSKSDSSSSSSSKSDSDSSDSSNSFKIRQFFKI